MTQSELDRVRVALIVARDCILALARAEQSSALGGIPSGHVYAILMPQGMNLEVYQALLESMEKAGLIRVVNHLILPA